MSEGSSSSSTNRNGLKRKSNGTVVSKEQKKPPMPTYGKYNILKILKESNCLIPDETELNKAFPRNKRYTLDEIKQFIKKSAQKSQSISDKNNKSTEFKRANNLIDSIEKRTPFTDRTMDIPLSLKTLTDVFNYEEEDISVQTLYQTLTNLSLGFPTAQLDDTTNDFLYRLYKEFIEQVNTKEFKNDVRKYQQFFDNKRVVTDVKVEMKHPTETNDMESVVKSTLNCPSINPLNIPYSLLRKPKDSS